jgi:chaperonin GroEL
MEQLVPLIESIIDKYKLEITPDNYQEILLKVATLSANGDVELAKSVIEAFDTVGEEGNLTIVELNGKTRYEVEKLNGYTIDQGYEESCRNFANGFINDKSGTMVTLNKPIFILYDGVISDLHSMHTVFSKMNDYLVSTHQTDRGVILLAHGFNETVIGDLHFNWNHPGTIKILPLLTPQAAIMNWRTHFLYDLQSYLGVPVFNPIDRPMIDMDFGAICLNSKAKSFEAGRFRSTVIAEEDQESINIRVEELKLQKEKAESEYELKDLEVRIGKLTAGIARLNVYGESQSQTRERRDRAEDAWMAIRGAIKCGACPGGGYILAALATELLYVAENTKELAKHFAAAILSEALVEPIKMLYRNYGYVETEIESQVSKLLTETENTFDIEKQQWVPKFDLLDSIPAVTEAIRNSISIASLLGTVGGIVAFSRNQMVDEKERQFARDYDHNVQLGEEMQKNQ